MLCGLTATTSAQTETAAASQFLDQAKSASDSQLGDIATCTANIAKSNTFIAIFAAHLHKTIMALRDGPS